VSSRDVPGENFTIFRLSQDNFGNLSDLYGAGTLPNRKGKILVFWFTNSKDLPSSSFDSCPVTTSFFNFQIFNHLYQ
jgi:hypothetical protein